MANAPGELKTAAVIPVKQLGSAKQRLSATLSAEARARLMETMFLDVLSQVRRCRTIDETIVVTADPTIARTVRWLGVELVEQEEDEGHSEAASAGAGVAVELGANRVAMLPADCPLLDPEEFDAHLGVTPRSTLIVPDRHETGTNALVLSPPDKFVPAFGPDSLARHIALAREAGTGFSVERIESLSLDLDTEADLRALRDALTLEPERAPRTSKLLFELGASEPADTAVA